MPTFAAAKLRAAVYMPKLTFMPTEALKAQVSETRRINHSLDDHFPDLPFTLVLLFDLVGASP